MYKSEQTGILISTFLSLLILGIFSVWAEVDKESLIAVNVEDGIMENLSAVFLTLTFIGFIVFAFRSNFLKNKENGFKYFFTISWILLMFVFVGEEISWGQRIFNFATPEKLAEINKQNEFNIHNIEIVDTFAGGQYRYLSIFMLTTGFLLPAFAMSKFGKRTIQKFAFPVCPLHYSTLLVGAYIWGKYYDPSLQWVAPEVREFLMSMAMCCFATHGAISPRTLFRICEPEKESSQT